MIYTDRWGDTSAASPPHTCAYLNKYNLNKMMNCPSNGSPCWSTSYQRSEIFLIIFSSGGELARIFKRWQIDLATNHNDTHSYRHSGARDITPVLFNTQGVTWWTEDEHEIWQSKSNSNNCLDFLNVNILPRDWALPHAHNNKQRRQPDH